MLADVQSPLALHDARFTGVTVELGETRMQPGTPLLLLARTTGTGVQIDVVDLFPFLDSGEAHVRCQISLTVSPVPPEEGVRVVRFQLG